MEEFPDVIKIRDYKMLRLTWIYPGKPNEVREMQPKEKLEKF